MFRKEWKNTGLYFIIVVMYRKYFLPLGVLLLLSVGIRWIDPLLNGPFGDGIVTVMRACLLFSFGLSLNVGKRKKHETWLRKVLISFILIFFLVWELGFVMIPELKNIFNFLGIYGYIVHLVYVYCGWSFFD